MLLHCKSVCSFFVFACKLRYGVSTLLFLGAIGCSQDEPKQTFKDETSKESQSSSGEQIKKRTDQLVSDENSTVTIDRNFSETILSKIEQNGTGLPPAADQVQENERTTTDLIQEDANQSTEGNFTEKIKPASLPINTVTGADMPDDSNRSLPTPKQAEKKEKKKKFIDRNQTKPRLEPVLENPSSDSNKTKETIGNFDFESIPNINLDDKSVFDRILSEALEVIPEIRPNGTVEFFEPLKKDPFTGSGWVAIYGANGKTILNLIQIEKGKAHGLATEWHPNGRKKSQGTFKEGKRHGTASDWYDNGRKKAKGNFKDGIREGQLTEWNFDGIKSTELHFKNGRFHGESTIWYATEQQERRSVFENGNLKSVSAWLPNGDKCPVTKVDQFGNGVVAKYDLDGNEQYRIFYRNGERQKK